MKWRDPSTKDLRATDWRVELGVALELVADCSTDEVGPVGIELLRYEKIDVTEVNETEIDRDLFQSLGSSLGARGPCRS